MKRFSLILDKEFREMVLLEGGKKIMRRIALGVILVLTVLCGFGVNVKAATYVPDAFSTAVYVQRSDTGAWQDVLGVYTFETFGYEYSQTGNNLEIKLVTNYPQAGYTGGNGVSWHTVPGDFMIDVNLDGTYDYALALVGHNDGSIPDGINDGTVTAGQLYKITTQYLAMAYKPAGFSGYYGTNWRYESSPGSVYPAYVRANGTEIVGTGSVSWTTYPTPPPYYRVVLNLDVTDFLPHGFSGDIGIYWSTATCANDVIAGTMSVHNNTPEPSTWLMIGSGLIGLVSFGCKKRKSC